MLASVPNEIVVREAGQDDAGIITVNNAAMALETEGKRLDPIKGRSGVDALLSDRSKGFYLVAESEGRVVGQCMVTFEWSDWRDGTFWWVQSVFVNPAMRRKGVFSSIFEFLLERADMTKGVVGLRLYVEQSNSLGKSVYKKLGLMHTQYEMWETEFTVGKHQRSKEVVGRP
jgi:GNAT superfamily N-acetyltransferase